MGETDWGGNWPCSDMGGGVWHAQQNLIQFSADGWGCVPSLLFTCPSISPKVCPSSYSLHQWCHPAISSSDALFSFCSQSFPGTFPMNHLFASDEQNTGASASASVLLVNIQGWSPLRLTGSILLFKGLSGVFSSTKVQSHQFFGILPSLQSSSHNCTWPMGRPQPWLYRPWSAE